MVRHDSFGVGRVRNIKRRAGQPRVIVDFQEAGRRELVLGFGNLEVVEDYGS